MSEARVAAHLASSMHQDLVEVPEVEIALPLARVLHRALSPCAGSIRTSRSAGGTGTKDLNTTTLAREPVESGFLLMLEGRAGGATPLRRSPGNRCGRGRRGSHGWSRAQRHQLGVAIRARARPKRSSERRDLDRPIGAVPGRRAPLSQRRGSGGGAKLFQVRRSGRSGKGLFLGPQLAAAVRVLHGPRQPAGARSKAAASASCRVGSARRLAPVCTPVRGVHSRPRPRGPPARCGRRRRRRSRPCGSGYAVATGIGSACGSSPGPSGYAASRAKGKLVDHLLCVAGVRPIGAPPGEDLGMDRAVPPHRAGPALVHEPLALAR